MEAVDVTPIPKLINSLKMFDLDHEEIEDARTEARTEAQEQYEDEQEECYAMMEESDDENATDLRE